MFSTVPSLHRGPSWFPHTPLDHHCLGCGCAALGMMWPTAVSGAEAPPSETPWEASRIPACQMVQGSPTQRQTYETYECEVVWCVTLKCQYKAKKVCLLLLFCCVGLLLCTGCKISFCTPHRRYPEHIIYTVHTMFAHTYYVCTIHISIELWVDKKTKQNIDSWVLWYFQKTVMIL